MRVKRGVTSHQRHKKVLKQTKGMQHARRSSIKLARQGVIRSLQYAYRDRRNKKRDFRALWITRINAAVREHAAQLLRMRIGHNVIIFWFAAEQQVANRTTDDVGAATALLNAGNHLQRIGVEVL